MNEHGPGPELHIGHGSTRDWSRFRHPQRQRSDGRAETTTVPGREARDREERRGSKGETYVISRVPFISLWMSHWKKYEPAASAGTL